MDHDHSQIFLSGRSSDLRTTQVSQAGSVVKWVCGVIYQVAGIFAPSLPEHEISALYMQIEEKHEHRVFKATLLLPRSAFNLALNFVAPRLEPLQNILTSSNTNHANTSRQAVLTFRRCAPHKTHRASDPYRCK